MEISISKHTRRAHRASYSPLGELDRPLVTWEGPAYREIVVITTNLVNYYMSSLLRPWRLLIGEGTPSPIASFGSTTPPSSIFSGTYLEVAVTIKRVQLWVPLRQPGGEGGKLIEMMVVGSSKYLCMIVVIIINVLERGHRPSPLLVILIIPVSS